MISGEKGLIVALDFGTSNIKGAVFDYYGNEAAFESVEYSLYTPEPSYVENDLGKYWGNICSILASLSKKLGDRKGEVTAISTSSQAETIVCVDKNINTLGNAIVWIDTRTVKEAAEIADNFDLIQMYKKTGYPEVDTSWPATRVLWIKRNEPEIFNKTFKFMLLQDYMIYKLSGNICGEATVYNSSYYYDIMNFEYIDSMLEFIGISKKKLPEIVAPGTIVGSITEEIASLTGFNRGTKVITGAMDQVCGAVGAGNIKKGIATESTGSAFAMVVTTGDAVINYEYKLPCILHAVKGTYALMPYSSTGGMVLKWFKDKFCALESMQALKQKTNVFKILDSLAKDIPVGSEGLIMLPFLTGAFFPEYNPAAKALYFGIGINHNKGHFIRAILEALGYMMRNDVEAIQKLGIPVEKIISIGGGASSALWSRIKSDICRINVEIPSYTETALLGSAIIAAGALGIYSSIEDAAKNLLKIKEVFSPDRNNSRVYDECFLKYKKLYESVKDLY